MLVGAGCRARTPAVPGPEGLEQAVSKGGAIPITVVEQLALTDVPAGFDPTGSIAVGPECQAWRADSVFLGPIPEDRCALWSDPEVVVAPDGLAVARLSGASVTLEGKAMRGSLRCEGCAAVQDLAWSGEGDRIALVREGGSAVEIWSVAQRSKLRELPLPHEGRVAYAELGWSGSLYVLLATADERPACGEGDNVDEDTGCIGYYESESFGGEARIVYSLIRYASLDAEPSVEALRAWGGEGPPIGYDLISSARLDPGGRCLYYEVIDSEPRASIGSRISSRSLEGGCDFDHPDDDAAGYWSLDSSYWLEPEELRAMLEIEGLAEDFFAGRPIAAGPTSVTAAQLEALGIAAERLR